MIAKKILNLFLSLVLVATLTTGSALASSPQYEYVPGYGMMPLPQDEDYTPQAVDNSGTFGLSVDDFRYMCMDTGGEWDVVSGRHICYCPAGEFNYPFGCPEVVTVSEENHYPEYPEYPDYDAPEYNEPDYEPYDPPENHYGVNFWDIGGHPDQYYIKELAGQGIIEGYPDGSFRPDQPVTRAEMAKMSLMAAKLETLPCDEDRNRFFVDLDSWQAPWVNAGYRMDIIEGYSGYNAGVRLFKPNRYVNRAEGVKLVLASFGRRPLDFEKISFVDVYDWMVPWIEDAYRIGLIDDTPGMRFYPAEPMTRGMAAKVLVRMLQYSGDI
jgi:hypothetical protein